MVGVIIPLAEESVYFQSRLDNVKEVTIDGLHYKRGLIGGKEVVFALSGMGKINSAIVSTRLIKDFHPDLVLMSGSSGAINPDLNAGDVVVGQQVINADFGTLTDHGTEIHTSHLVSPQTHTALPLLFKMENKLMESIAKIDVRTEHLPKIVLGQIGTTDTIPNVPPQSTLLRQSGVDVVEMEGASLMQACWFSNVSCAVIRGVSNKAGTPIFKGSISMAGNNAAKVLLTLIAQQPIESRSF